MSTADLLQTFLQVHLASDASAVTHLPFILQNLTALVLERSSQLSKWNARTSSLIHSRESGARWAGLCIAKQTAVLSKNIVLQAGQGWVTVVLPMLSRIENIPVYKASIRLLACIFEGAVDFPDFQRQVATPNIPKFSQALVHLCQKQTDHELHTLCAETLAAVLISYPSAHRPLQPILSAFAISRLNSVASPPTLAATDSAARLNANLHLLGGKTGAAGLWRKGVDDIISHCYAVHASLRISYGNEGHQPVRNSGDTLEDIPIHLEHLRHSIELLCALLGTTAPRPVPVPIAAIAELCVTLMKSTAEPPKESLGHYDATRRVLEIAAVPHILAYACRLIGSLSTCVKHHLVPHMTRILSIVAFHLEAPCATAHRVPFVKLLPTLLTTSFHSSEPLLVGRILKTLLPVLASILSPAKAQASSTLMVLDSAPHLALNGSGGKRSRKRTRVDEAEDILGGGKMSSHLSQDDGKLILSTLDALPLILRTPGLPPYLVSLTSRVLLSLQLTLSTKPSVTSASDAVIRETILMRVQRLNLEGAASVEAGRGVLSRTLPIIASCGTSTSRLLHETSALLDLMVHPRLPPLIREVPLLGVLALSYTEEDSDERATREALGLGKHPKPSEVNDILSMDVARTENTDVGTKSAHPASPGFVHTQPSAFASHSVAMGNPIFVPTIPRDVPNAGSVPKRTIDVSNESEKSTGSDQMPIADAWSSATQQSDANSLQFTAPSPQSLRKPDVHDQMQIDDEDEDDIEVPPIDMESDTDED